MPEAATKKVRCVKWQYTTYYEANVDEAEVAAYFGEEPTDEQIAKTVEQYMHEGDGKHVHGLLGDNEGSPYGEAGLIEVEVLRYCEKHPTRLVEESWGRGKGWCMDCWSESREGQEAKARADEEKRGSQ